jgi:nucleotide-binding universal stress UspA family protein
VKKIVVATDGSAASEKAIDRAIELAKTHDVEIIVVNVAEDYCPIGLVEVDCETIREIAMKESKAIMQAAIDKFKASSIEARGIIEYGSPVDTIIDIVKREKADEIIAASHGRHGAKKLLMGSVTSRLVEWAPCPVVVVK